MVRKLSLKFKNEFQISNLPAQFSSSFDNIKCCYFTHSLTPSLRFEKILRLLGVVTKYMI